MRKSPFVLLALIVWGLPRLLSFIGLSGTPDDLATWGRWMTQIGATNFVALAILALATYLFFLEWHDRRKMSEPERFHNAVFSALKDTRLSRLQAIDKSHILQTRREAYKVPRGMSALDVDEIPDRYCLTIEGLTLKIANNRGRPAAIQSCKFIAHSGAAVRNAEINGKLVDGRSTQELDGHSIATIRLPLERLGMRDFRGIWSGFDLKVETVDGYRKTWTFRKDYVEWLLFNNVTSNWKEPRLP